MTFIPKEYDLHPNGFHTYGINWASMTFIPSAVWSSYCGCEKTFVIPKLCVKFILHCALLQTVLLGQRSRELVEGKSTYAMEILDSAWSVHAAMAWSSANHISRQISYAAKSIVDETFCWKFGSVYLLRGGWELCYSCMVLQTRLATH